MATSLQFEAEGQVVHVIVEGEGKGPCSAHSLETRLHSDDWELQEGQEEDSASQVRQVFEPFGLTKSDNTYCSASATYLRVL